MFRQRKKRKKREIFLLNFISVWRGKTAKNSTVKRKTAKGHVIDGDSETQMLNKALTSTCRSCFGTERGGVIDADLRDDGE